MMRANAEAAPEFILISIWSDKQLPVVGLQQHD